MRSELREDRELKKVENHWSNTAAKDLVPEHSQTIVPQSLIEVSAWKLGAASLVGVFSGSPRLPEIHGLISAEIQDGSGGAARFGYLTD